MKQCMGIYTLNPISVTSASNSPSIDCAAAGAVAVVSVITPTAATGATVQAFWSLDGLVWIAIGSPTTCTSNTTFNYSQDRPWFKYLRLQFAISTGSLAVSTNYSTNKDI